MRKTPDKNQCPLCEKANLCDVDNKQGCWCVSAKIPKELLNNLANEEKNKRCICQACIEKFKLGQAI